MTSIGSPPLFRDFLAGYPQDFAQAFEGKSAEYQRLFHIFCTRFPYTFKPAFFRSFFVAIPEEIADSAEKKMWEGTGAPVALRKNVLFDARTPVWGRPIHPLTGVAQRL